MKVIENKDITHNVSTAVTLGNFDGVHLGHQKLISTVMEYASKEKLMSVVFSFYPHPLSLFNKDETFYTIFSRHEKEIIIKDMGVDELIQYPFTMEFANLEAEDFANILFERLKTKVLVVGADYCFGKGRKGTYDLLKQLGEEKGVKVIKINSVNYDNERVSSTRIRECIRNGNIKLANILLNKNYFIKAKVSEGNKIGRSIGFPTANIIAPENKLLPPDGVYMTKVFHKGQYYESITNIGMTPTFGGNYRKIETHIFNFSKSLYDEEISVIFYDFIRKEHKFSSADELKEQIKRDKKKVLENFKNLLN